VRSLIAVGWVDMSKSNITSIHNPDHFCYPISAFAKAIAALSSLTTLVNVL
jgi:hypothetical protein